MTFIGKANPAILLWGGFNIPSGTGYLRAGSEQDTVTSTPDWSHTATRDGFLCNLFIRHNDPLAGDDIIYTIYINDIPTSFTATLNAESDLVSNTTDIIAVSEGDTLDIISENSGSSVNIQSVASLEFHGVPYFAQAPDEIPGLFLWLRGDLDASEDMDGYLTEWLDQSGNGQTIDITEPPHVISYDPDLAVQSIEFIRDNGEYVQADTAGLVDVKTIHNGEDLPSTVFCIGKLNSLGSGTEERTYWSWNRSSSGSREFLFEQQTNVATWRSSKEGTGGNMDVPVDAGADDLDWHYFTAAHTGTATTIYIDGVNINTDDEDEGDLASNEFGIGARLSSVGPSNFFDGRIYELIVYNRLLTVNEISQVHAYIRNNVFKYPLLSTLGSLQLNFDANGGVTEDTSPDVTDWVNFGDAGNSVEQLTASAMPHLSSIGGETALFFDGSDDELVYTGAKSDTNFLHDGSGMTLFFVYHYDSGFSGGAIDRMFSTSRAGVGPSRIGIRFSIIRDDETVEIAFSNGSDFIIFETISAPHDETHIIIMTFDNSAYSIYIDDISSPVASGVPLDSGSGSDSFEDLTLGSAGSSTLEFVGYIMQFGAYDEVLSGDNLSNLHATLEDRWA